jgi:nucleoid-associated protein YgaU
MNFAQFKQKYLKSTEEVVSMFLGLAIVVTVTVLIFNYFQKSKGSITIPGASDDISLNQETESVKNNDYEVVKGDSLWKIAVKKYGNGYAWTEIAKANKLKNPSSLEVGQKIIVPEKVVVAGKDIQIAVPKTVVTSNDSNLIVPGGEYKVVKGDSLWKIAVKAYGDGYQWPKIWQENKTKLPRANGLEVGMVLVVPRLN